MVEYGRIPEGQAVIPLKKNRGIQLREWLS